MGRAVEFVSGGGINFHDYGAGHRQSIPTLLSDYEEGTFTPNILVGLLIHFFRSKKELIQIWETLFITHCLFA